LTSHFHCFARSFQRGGLRQDALGDRAQAHQLRVVVANQGLLGLRLFLELLVLLRGLLLDDLDRHDLADGRAAALHADAIFCVLGLGLGLDRAHAQRGAGRQRQRGQSTWQRNPARRWRY